MPYALVRWRFDDPVALDSHVFAINPNAGGSPTLHKRFQYETTSAPDGKSLVFEGRDNPQKIDFSGVILEQVDYDAMVTWFNKRNQIKVTDDLGREFYVVIEGFEATRKRSANYPWRHDYKVSATVVDWP